MDPSVATIIKQGVVLGLGVGALAFAVFFLARMAGLRHAMTLSMIPPALIASGRTTSQ